MIRNLCALMLALLAACAPEGAEKTASGNDATTPDPDTVEVMVVGSFHMGNPGNDIANAEVENMLTNKRQAEMAATAEALAAFKPTVVVVERITEAPDYIDPKFQEFTREQLLEVPDERYQIGYRLADLAGVTRVYGIDEKSDEGEPDYFPFGKLMAHAEATGQSEAMNAAIASLQGLVARFSGMQKTKSIAELFIVANDYDELSDPKSYYEFAKFDRGEDQPGAELLAYWYMRNAKIFSKLMQVVKPGDRVVVVYGAGHKYWIEHFADHTPGFVSVDPVPYLEKAAPIP